MNNTNTFPLPPFAFALESTIDLPIHSPVATMDLTRAAGFYVASWGRLPYSFGAPQPERFLVFRTRPPPGSR
jgi:hypothetical protein